MPVGFAQKYRAHSSSDYSNVPVMSLFIQELMKLNANCEGFCLSLRRTTLPPTFLTVWLSSCHPLLTHYGGNALERRTKVTLHQFGGGCCCREPLLFPDSIKESSRAGLRLPLSLTMHHSQEIASYFSRQEVKRQRHPCMCHFLGSGLGWEWALVSYTNAAWGAVEERCPGGERPGGATEAELSDEYSDDDS